MKQKKWIETGWLLSTDKPSMYKYYHDILCLISGGEDGYSVSIKRFYICTY